MAERLGRYSLEKRLGVGGMGEVFLARRDDGLVVVVKRLHPHLAADSARRDELLAEAGLVARFTHPNIARVLELGEVEGQWFVAMEYVDGPSVATLATRGAMDVGQACALGRDLALALDHAHRAGVVHRDVSPHNLLVGREGAAKLIDFGVARRVGRGEPADLMGKVSYLAPERLQGAEADARADQYSLGVVLWELLSGKHLFERASDIETIDAVERGVVPPLPRTVPEVVASVVRRMMARTPAQRFSSCAEVAEALAPFAPPRAPVADSSPTVSANPSAELPRWRTPWVARPRDFARLERLATPGSTVLVVGAAGSGVSRLCVEFARVAGRVAGFAEVERGDLAPASVEVLVVDHTSAAPGEVARFIAAARQARSAATLLVPARTQLELLGAHVELRLDSGVSADAVPFNPRHEPNSVAQVLAVRSADELAVLRLLAAHGKSATFGELETMFAVGGRDPFFAVDLADALISAHLLSAVDLPSGPRLWVPSLVRAALRRL